MLPLESCAVPGAVAVAVEAAAAAAVVAVGSSDEVDAE
jgi:hypothetical protein